MATRTHGTVIGVFQDHDQARNAIRALKDAGFAEDQIGVASSKHEGLKATRDDDVSDESYAGEGAVTGVAAGAGLGALWGLGILAGALPAIGPAIAGGTLAVILSSAAAGAAAAGLTGALIGMGISKEEAEYYESEMKAGRTIVTVNAGSRRNEALAVMQQFGGYDMSNRMAATRESSAPLRGTSTHGATAAPLAHTTTTTSGEGQTLQAREEKLHVEKTPVEHDVTVRKEVHTEHKTIDVPVTREEIVVERHTPTGKKASGPITGGPQEVRVPIKEEQVNVEKETVVSEEVNIGKRKVQDTKQVDATLRKEDIKVEQRGDACQNDPNKGKSNR